MPEALLSFLTLCCVALLYLFLFRVVRAVWAELRPPTVLAAGTAAASSSATKGAAGRGLRRNRNGTRLVVLEPKERRGQTYELVDELTVGRAPGCAVLLDDGYTSALHARIFLRDGRRMVEDLGSTNGTFLNAKALTAPAVVRRGDRIKVGATVLEVN